MRQEIESGLMNNLPLITVIIPVYNVKDFLTRCVHSVTRQTYRRLEILLVDDGSTDGSGELCDRLAEEDSRIQVFHKKNGGSSSARNKGLELSKGEFVGFVDSDDYIEPDMYEKLIQGIQEYGAGIAQIGRNEIDEKGNLLPDICIPPAGREFLSSRDFMRELLMHRGDCSFCTKLIRRELMEGRQFPEGKLNEDFWLLIQMLPETKGILSLPDYGYHVFYRLGSNSRRVDADDFPRVFGDCVDNADLARELTAEHYPELSREAFRFGVFQRLEYLLHIPISRMTKENRQYRDIVRDLRKCWAPAMANPLLTGKNKLYHTLFAISPKGIRVLHRALRKRRSHGKAGF